MIKAGQVIAGKYTLLEAFASGGMGSVWRARHGELEVDVAVKFMGSDLLTLDIALERFRREARAAAKVRSPHVVQLNDYGIFEGIPYIVMEFLEGEDLRSLLRREGAIGYERARGVVTQIAKALRLAHEAGIVHRDLKPANVFLARTEFDEVVKVLDFGVAKMLAPDDGSAQTTTGAVLGSPLYMSPEQARGSRVDHRSDLWSLGIVALEMVTGQHPLRGCPLGDILVRICTEDMPLPSANGVDIPGLDAFFARALARDADSRFQSAKAMADAFLDLGSGASLAPSVPQSPLARGSLPSTGGLVEPRAAVTGDRLAFGRDHETVDIGKSGEPPPPAPRRKRVGALIPIVASASIGVAAAVAVFSFRGPSHANGDASSSLAASSEGPATAAVTASAVPANAAGSAPPEIEVSATPAATATAIASASAPAAVPRPPPPSPQPKPKPTATTPPTSVADQPQRDPIFGLPERR